MSPNDADYKLSHEQLIKATKVLLHKFNCQDIKNVSERDSLEVRIDEKFRLVDASRRSDLEEQC